VRSKYLGTTYAQEKQQSGLQRAYDDYQYLPHQHFYVYDFYDVIAFGMWDQGYNNTFSRFANLRTTVGTVCGEINIKNQFFDPTVALLALNTPTIISNKDAQAYTLHIVSSVNMQEVQKIDIGANQTKSIVLNSANTFYVYNDANKTNLVGQIACTVTGRRVVPFMQRECIAMGIHYPYNALRESDKAINDTLTGPPPRTLTASLPYTGARPGYNEPSLFWGNNGLAIGPAVKTNPNTWKITVNYYIKEPVVQTWLTSSVLEGWFGNIAKYSCRLGTCPYNHLSKPIADINQDGVIDAADGPGVPVCQIDQFEREVFLPQNTE
jgi:hypothetical protein